jgi:hypothetical protein
MLAAMGNLNPSRLLDPRYLDAETAIPGRTRVVPIVTEL